MGYITESLKRQTQENLEKVSQLEAFKNLVKHKAKILIGSGVAVVAISATGYIYSESLISSIKETQEIASKLSEVYSGTEAISAKETEILLERESQAKQAIEKAKSKDKIAYSLFGKDSDSFGKSLSGEVVKVKAELSKAVESETLSRQYLKDHSSANLDGMSNRSDFKAKTKYFYDLTNKYNYNLKTLEGLAKWGGSAGFSSVAVKNITSSVDKFSLDVDTRLSQLEKEILSKSKDFDSTILDKRAQAMHDDVYKDLKNLYQKDLNAQIEGYKANIKNAARDAFRKEGESMSEYDWRKIEQDLDKDPEWQNAINGLTKVYAEQTLEAASVSISALKDERDAAEKKLNEIKSSGSTSGLSPVEMLLLYHWLSGPTPSYNSYTPHSYSNLYNSGANLSGTPAVGLTSSSARSVVSNASWQPTINKTSPNNVKASPIVYTKVNNVVPNFAHTDIKKYAQKQAQAAAANARNAATERAYNKATEKAAQEASARKAKEQAEFKAKSEANKAATQSSQKAAQKAAEKAASNAAAQSAHNAAVAASSRAARVAAEKAAVSAANKAASAASSKAASKAASKASSGASSRSSSSSSSRSSYSSGSSRSSYSSGGRR